MSKAPRKPLSRRRRIGRWFKRGLLCVLAFLILYALAALFLGAVPVNRDWVEHRHGRGQPEKGVEIYVWSHGIHADLLLPVHTNRIDWRTELPLADQQHSFGRKYVSIGWGDHDFYVVTPRWDQIQVSTTLKSLLLPTDSVMHVTYYWNTPPRNASTRVTLSEAEYDRLVTFIQDTFQRDERGKPRRLDGKSYWDQDAFFHAKGCYHLFDTCNNWVNTALKTTGVRTAVWAPFGFAILNHLPRR